jgi:hypothetical protein
VKKYFSGTWKDNDYQGLSYSGYQLVDYVNQKNPNSVLDVGCGFNKFKGKIHNLIGIDPYNDAADIKISLEEYQTTSHDIILCLGSINFGDERNIDLQIEKLDKMWKNEIIFRVNPGIIHDWVDKNNIDGIEWYKWTLEKINLIAKNYNYSLTSLKEEYTLHGHLRYYFTYIRNL